MRTTWGGIALALLCGAFMPGCESTGADIPNSEEFCSNIESTPVTAGGRRLVGVRAYTLFGELTEPLGEVDVSLETVGGLARDPEFDLRVCPEDCTFAADDRFTDTAVARTDEDGILIFTLLSGNKTSGLVLADFGSTTCAVSIIPRML